MRISTQITVGFFIVSLASVAWSADVVSIWGGARGTIILKSDGTVWTWGANFDGKLGLGRQIRSAHLCPGKFMARTTPVISTRSRPSWAARSTTWH